MQRREVPMYLRPEDGATNIPKSMQNKTGLVSQPRPESQSRQAVNIQEKLAHGAYAQADELFDLR